MVDSLIKNKNKTKQKRFAKTDTCISLEDKHTVVCAVLSAFLYSSLNEMDTSKP